jgi:hypothetical protein
MTFDCLKYGKGSFKMGYKQGHTAQGESPKEHDKLDITQRNFKSIFYLSLDVK